MDHSTMWDQAWSLTIGRQVRLLREKFGYSAQQLADRCEHLGYPVPRATIAKTERGGRRTVPVQEVAVLARALGVPPLRLLVDVRDGASPVEVLPGTEVLPVDALEWFAGGDNGPFEGQRELDPLQRARRELELQFQALHFLRRVAETEQDVLDVEAGVVDLGDTDDEREFFEQQRHDALDKARYGLRVTLAMLVQTRRTMVDAGMTPPPLPDELVEPYKARMVELGYPDAS